MKSGSEIDVREGVQALLEKLAPDKFLCIERKTLRGASVINKPVDLQVSPSTSLEFALIAIEVANVNTTQLVGETCRLYYDCCPRKLMILGDRNVPRDGKEQCEQLLSRLYGQAKIQDTPARVALFSEDSDIEAALRDLLLIERALTAKAAS